MRRQAALMSLTLVRSLGVPYLSLCQSMRRAVCCESTSRFYNRISYRNHVMKIVLDYSSLLLSGRLGRQSAKRYQSPSAG
jgi:hypothetical protein